jgi:rhodanese-related sulfurtransferase/DNA-binding transcriptional ArsR family regulator
LYVKKDDRFERGKFKRAVFEHLAVAGTALADPRRIAMLDFICQAPKAVEAVAAEFGCSAAVASHHLRWLKRAGLAVDARAGRRILYRASELGEELWRALSHAGERYIDDVREAVASFPRDGAEYRPTSLPELLRRVDVGDVVLIDVRPRDEYDAGHLPGALSMPLDELRERIAELPRNSKIAAYCRGPYCVLSHEAVVILRKAGRRAFRISESVMNTKRPARRDANCNASASCAKKKSSR